LRRGQTCRPCYVGGSGRPQTTTSSRKVRVSAGRGTRPGATIEGTTPRAPPLGARGSILYEPAAPHVLAVLLAFHLVPAVCRLVEFLGEPGQFRTQEVPGRHLAHRDPQRRDLPGQVLGVRLLHGGPPPVLLHGE